MFGVGNAEVLKRFEHHQGGDDQDDALLREMGQVILSVGERDAELTGSTVTKYYFAGRQRVATPALAPGASVRKYTGPSSMTVEFFLGDDLGSTSVTTDNTGSKVSELISIKE